MEPRPYWVHDISPYAFRIGGLAMTWYQVFMAITVVGGAVLWLWQLRRGGRLSKKFIWILPLGILMFFVSIHLGDSIFYHFEYTMSRPWSALEFWRGGYSSHGALLGGALLLLMVARQTGMPMLESCDRFAFTTAWGTFLVRIGNFLNSEVVGRRTDLPWGVRFMRFDGGFAVRHPVQLYEAALGLCVFALLLVVDARTGRERRPRGLLCALYLVVYFGGRLALEFTKEFESLDPSTSLLTLGQYLSIVPFVGGLYLLWRVLRRGDLTRPAK